MNYTQTTTANEPERQPPYAGQTIANKRGKFILTVAIVVIIVLAIVCAFMYGKSQGIEETKAKQTYEQAKTDIKAVETEKEVDKVETREASQTSVKQAKIIRDNAFKPMPVIRDTILEAKIKYLKKLKP